MLMHAKVNGVHERCVVVTFFPGARGGGWVTLGARYVQNRVKHCDLGQIHLSQLDTHLNNNAALSSSLLTPRLFFWP